MSDPRRAALGLPPDASLDQVKVAFRELALRLHPDVAQDAASAAQFARVMAAYKSLTAHEAPATHWTPPPARRGWTGRAGMRTALAVCGATFVSGVFVFWGAWNAHQRFDLYSGNRYVPRTSGDSDVRSAVAHRRRRTAGGEPSSTT